MLRDRLVCGINDEHIQRRLLAEHSLDFKKALKIATSMETAVKSSGELANQMAKEVVNSQKSTTANRVDSRSQRDHVDGVAVNMTPNIASFVRPSVSFVRREDTLHENVEATQSPRQMGEIRSSQA